MHTTPYRAPAKPVWPFLVPISGRPERGAESVATADEDAPDPAFGHDESGAVTAATGKVVAFRFRTDLNDAGACSS
jgi:hypothetical protein